MGKTFFLQAKDGVDIHVRLWEASNQKAVLQLVHGMNEHAGRYEEFASFLNEKGVTVIATDHRGHGQTARAPENVGYIGENGFLKMVEDEKMVFDWLQSKMEITHPYYILGHSMGSFVTQRYIQLYGSELDGAILMGSCGYNGLVKPGQKIAAIVEKIVGDKRIKLLEKIVFSKYNSKTEKRTTYDWLAADDAVVDAFMADPFCAKVFPVSFYRQFLQWLQDIFIPEEVDKVVRDLPIFLVAGSNDPVGLHEKGMYRLQKQYEDIGVQSVEMKLYTKSRHEILNDVEKKMVYHDIYSWIKKQGNE